MDLAVKVNDPKLPQQRATAAAAALARLQQAAAVIPQLPPKRQTQARFAVGVWRADVHWRHGTMEARQAAAKEALAARREAQATDVYHTYYRLQCLIILWRCLDYTVFQELGDDAKYNDRAYLFGSQPEADVERGKAQDLLWPLRLMRLDLRLLKDELSAVNELRKSAEMLEVEAVNDPAVAAWHQLCLMMLARHYMEQRDWTQAQRFVDQLPSGPEANESETTRQARLRIARAREDWDTVEALARALARRDDAYYLFVAEALENKHRYRDALSETKKVFRKPGLTPETRAAALDQEADCRLRLADAETDATERDKHLKAADEALAQAFRAVFPVKSLQALAERAEIRKDHGRLLERRNQPEEAYQKFLESIDQLEAVRSRIPLYRGSFLNQDPEQLSAVDGVLRTYATAGYGLTEALVEMDRLKSRDLLDWLAQPPSPENLARYRRALRDVALGTDLPRALEELGVADSDRQRGQIIHGGIEMNRLLEAFPDACFLSYWAGEEKVFLLAVTTGAGGERHLLELGERGKALKLVADAYTQVRTPESKPWQALDDAAQFFLPGPVQPLLGRVQRVVVCPAADLHRLPFAALRIDGKPLGVVKQLVTVPSLAILRVLSTRTATGNGLVLVHSATLPEAEAKLLNLGPLRFSKHEADLVAANYEVLATREGAAATLANLRPDLDTYAGRVGVVHLSAHAVEHVNIPSRSLLMLSDGPADMASVATLELGGSLVVLSNCLSKGAAARGGEGVNGLAWGFLAAGARAVVASQWRVNQQATADLMGQFHYFRGRGHNAAEAMRRARQRLSAADNYKHPYYWAGFEVVGPPFAPQRRGSWSYGWLLAAMGILAGYLLLRSGPKASPRA